ncbi:E3 ubiquitin-protein ligase RNF213 isoform X1 [Sciurus carolinensis]|uniref:E3 ubiquitin-protein ligase RNF213 isoform X1 n=1 Tax=Sciurus carolinensis TaxID=30640 RepID=UPI001FB20E90|nr:E3 ubiquitin-protein ligase RNF213 isoform X1 [Sciurus carolinensis]XP_047401154.1 E3 ubiquitin-protein ligase RNF213 isoform X1 [Sciurus carolinensis]
MECPRCQHVSQEEAPRFCSQCGERLPPAAPKPDPEGDSLVAPALEEEMECGDTLKEDGDTLKEDGDLPLSPDSSGWQENAAEPGSDDDRSWTLQRSKRKKRRKNQGASASVPGASSPQSPNSPSCPGSQGTAPAQSPAQQAAPANQPGQPLGTGVTLLEGAGPVTRAEESGSPLQGQPAQDRGASAGEEARGSAAPQDRAEGRGLHTCTPPGDRGLSQEVSDPQSSACEAHPKAEGAAQGLPLPESKGDSEPQKEAQRARQQAGCPASGGVDAAAEPDGPVDRAGKAVDDQPPSASQPPAGPPAAKEHRQEAQTKDGSAASGKKRGENISEPKDPRKPEGTGRSHAAAVKKEKEQQNRQASPLSPEEGVTVYFHAILSKDFAFDPELHTVFVRGGEGLGRPAWSDACEMYYVQDLHENGSLIEGSIVIPRQSLDKAIPYKYVLHRGRGPDPTVEYEYIYKPPQKAGEHVNRCLCVRSSLLCSGDWHQYDDIICMRPPGKFQKFQSFFTDKIKKDLVRGKQLAAETMLGRILSVLQTWNPVNLRSFFSLFRQFFSVVRVPMVYEGKAAQPWISLNLGEAEVKKHLWKYLKKQLGLSLEGRSGDALPEGCPVRSRLRRGLLLLFLVEDTRLYLPEGDLTSLCSVLCPSTCSPDALHGDLCDFLVTSERWREYLVDLCQRCMDAKVVDWLGVLPVLHYCMQLEPPRKDLVSQPADVWAALEGIPFLKFQEKTLNESQLLHFMESRKQLLQVDEYLFRSWFSLLPLGSLVPYMENTTEYLSLAPARVLDCFLGTLYRLQGLQEISYQNVEDVENVFKMLRSLLEIYQDRIPGVTLLESYSTVCLKLHEAVCKLTTRPNFYEMPALSAEIVCGVIGLRPLVDAAQDPGSAAGKGSLTGILQGVLATTRSWLGRVFARSMFLKHTVVQFTYPEEIQVWRRLVGINFPAGHGWKESLLGDMEGRLKQERPLCQISVFCSTLWDAAGLEDSVARTFEKCVIEAVSSACQSQTSILEGVSCHDLQKFGSLVSAVVTKSWPRNNGEAVEGLDEILEHLLTGPDVKQLFKLYGTDEKLLANLTEDAKKLMAAAGSVFTKVAADVLAGSVLVGQLELILKHQRRFLDLWQLERKSSSFQEKNCDMKETLDWRKGEVLFLKREKRQVDSLLRLCGKVKHLVQVDFGEIEARHSEDLNCKRLDEAVSVSQPSSSPSKPMTHYKLDPRVQEMAGRIDSLMDSHIFQLFWEEAAESLSDPRGESERQTLELLEAFEFLYSPCYQKFVRLYQDLKSGEVTFAEIDVIFKDFVDKYNDLISDLHVMCELDPQAKKGWISERVEQIKEYHSLHQAISSAKAILQVKKNFGLTGDFSVLYTLINFSEDFEATRHEKLDQISPQLIQAKKLLQGISEPRRQCLEELALQQELVSWLHGALGGLNELKVFVDLASISAGENDIDVDRVACLHDAVQGYASLLYKLDTQAGFSEFMELLNELWKALRNDPHLPSKLRDSARNLEWLKTVKESHGSIELSSLSLATAINNSGVYMIGASTDDQKLSADAVLRLFLPGGHSGLETPCYYSLEELKELLNKLMLMSGKKDQKNVEVETFSEVFCLVQRLVQAFMNLYSAGNMLFRTWTAQVSCCPTRGFSIHMDFHLELVSQLSALGDVTELLEALCRQMESFLGDWKAFVTRKRARHFYLNFYTAEQLVLLSTELLKESPSGAALTMLSFIKGNCTPADVQRATAECREATRHHARTVTEKIPLLLSSEGSLVAKLRVIMEQSLKYMSAFLPGYLDLEALGRCLAHLARMDGPPVERSLPVGLQAGQPNLVLCGHSEVLLAALAIYMQAPGQPLPTFDEVLLCTPGTTFEEVALLLRRCLAPVSQGHKVYSLLFADQLSYEVGCQAEALFRSLCTQCCREDYQLVLVCDAARERCYLPSAFSQHKVHLVPQAPLHAIQAYLARHFQVPAQTPSAAAVFKDRMCVGIVASERAGVGKSLYVKRLHEKLMKFNSKKVPLKIIRLTDAQVDESRILSSLLPFLDAQYQKKPMIFHIDVTTSVQTGTWVFLFKLLILQYLMDISGKMWLRNPCHLYIIEIPEGSPVPPKRSSKLNPHVPQFSFLDIFPKVTCRPPKEVIDMELNPERNFVEPGMDQREFRSATFQRPYQYLKRFHQKQNLDTFQYQEGSVEGTPGECIQHLLIYCGVINPSWSELRNFARFLNCQLKDCEASVFCNAGFTGDTLRGFKNFVVTFMIFMARDFATPTLHTSDQSPGKLTVTMDGVDEEELAPFTLRRRWESEPHPYVFFNGDHVTMTFIGFYLQPNENGSIDAINHLNGKIIKKDVMTAELYRGLSLQRVPFNVDFDNLPRHEKLLRLCLALGIPWAIDPDETYELTTDNILKILAIEMRFRCGIPVIIMGETGCGKTRLIKFLSDLRRAGAQAETMKLVKVHGGTTAAMIHSKVREAENIAFSNKGQHQLDTILFFDEANTTEAISCIKEVLCDRTVDGQPLEEDSGLHIIAACNPYRKHTQETIRRLESAGLGYRVGAEETTDRLGSIPLRQLVYRVHALPPSLIPLVWDFGQLNDTAEKLYIRQIVQRLVNHVRVSEGETQVITEVLAASQRFMRDTENECSFVSLRDVERCVKVFMWFHDHSKMLLVKLDTFLRETGVSKNNFRRDPVLWSLVLAVGVCYHASLEEKESYRRAICRCFPEPYDDSRVILDEVMHTQDLFLSGVPLRKTIARNLALKENVFMMIICIELKIPLFLVGKPGSSKSLAKTIVADAMQGQAAHSALFRSLKQVHLVSFQCSPHSTPQGIINTFRQCARFQQGKDLQQYVSVVVLDEVGLAEDSPKMPLKALHPLLEDGCIEDDPAPHKKVGFIGISNWALDPAKMNRGIFVTRSSPSEEELIESARGICSADSLVQDRVRVYFAPFAKAYETVCQRQDKEFFGLRDYYSLIKMVFATTRASKRKPSPQDIARAVLRNFSGKDDIPALDIFMASLPAAGDVTEVGTLELIKQNICGNLQGLAAGELEDAESRYLLVLTKNYVALQILQQSFFSEDQQPEIIFGSSFPRDQEYTQICRNINRVKICMETGRVVVLLNLQHLYESLYDALNQYYVYLGGQKYVDLGLGTHRVKCRVHPDFRLIVVEEKSVVYEQFPVPLINRLEKHYLDISSVLQRWQKDIVRALTRWVQEFADVKAHSFLGGHKYSPADVFVGYHSDACASVVLQAVERQGPRELTEELYHRVSEEAKLVLLDCATPDAVVRLGASALGSFAAQTLSREYWSRQQHHCFADFLRAHLCAANQERHALFTEVTTFSRLLTSVDGKALEDDVSDLALKPVILSLQQFDTEYSFLKEVRSSLVKTAKRQILIFQMDFDDGTRSAQLLASAKYSAINEINKIQGTRGCVFVYFITKLSRMGSGASYVGFHGGLWRSVHIDDLRRSTVMASDVTKLQSVTISQLFMPGDGPAPEGSQEEAMEAETSKAGEVAEVEMEEEGPEEMECAASNLRSGDAQVLDSTSLLRSCVQSAVGLLRDQESCTRNMRRVTVLLGLLSGDSGCSASFLRIAKMRLHVLLKKQEENQLCSQEWVAREAANQDALQEAGTFRHALWKRVQGAVTPLLASMVALIDRDGNLELLIRPDSPAWAQDLWMFIFNDTKFLSIPLVGSDIRSRSEMSSIVVQNHMSLPEGASNGVPFSWRIRDHLEELWVQAQYITDAKGLSGKLVEIFQQTPLGMFLAGLPRDQQQELVQCYSRDFLLLTMRVSTCEELKFLQMALWSCICELRAASGRPEDRLCLPWVHLAYQHCRTRLHNFSRILTIHPQVLQSLTEAVQKHDAAGSEMTLDVFAAMACVEMLTRDTLKPSPQAWLQLVKKLSMPLELLCSEGYLRDSGPMARAVAVEVRRQWDRVLPVALFVEHVLLGTKSQVPELCQLVTKCVFSLDKCLQENSNLKTHRPFAAVMTTLCQCKEQASKSLARFGVQPCPICLGDARDPVCLPCDHVYCLPCIRKWLVPGQMTCPYCLTDLPDEFSLTVSQEHRVAIWKHAQFRQMCNGFFVDLVSSVCFKDNTPPEKGVIDGLLSLLFVQKELLRDAPQRHREHTKRLSPFDDAVDKTPVIRSVVLKLLLKYSFRDVKDYIQAYLSLLEKKAFITEDKTELYMLFINCLEDSIHEKTSAHCESSELSCLKKEGHFLQTCSSGSRGQGPAAAASVEYLQEVARVRLCLDRAADLLVERQDGSELAEEQRCYLRHVEQFCTRVGDDWHRVYLVRRLASLRGMEFVQSLSRQGHQCQWVFPKGVITQQKDHTGQMDRYLVHGEDYKALRDMVGKAMLERKARPLGTAQTACRSPRARQEVYLLLALYREVAALHRSHNPDLHPKPEQREAVSKFVEDSGILSPSVRPFATSLVANTLPLLSAGPGAGSLEGTVIEMAVHAAAVLLCGQSEVLAPLRNLAFSPASMANAFLPTMPEDLLAQAQSWEGLENVHWYTCPNGHPCSVGECGRPMEQSSCVDCGAVIGGIDHKPHAGFHAIRPSADRTRTGHVLGNPQHRDVVVVSDRELSPVVFIILRLLTHLAMLLGATQSSEALVHIIKPPVRDPKGFLQQHIQRDLGQLTKMLGKSADETTHVIHLVLRCLLKEQRPLPGHRHLTLDAQLSTKEQRNNWEKHVEALLLPELEHLDKTLLTVSTLISQDERVSSNPVAKIIYGDPASFLPRLPQRSVVHCSKIWSCRKKVTLEHLQHVVERKNGKETVPLLWQFLQKEAELRLVKFLPEILALQRDLVKRFQNVPEDKYSSIRSFISSHSSDGLRQLLHNRITVFLSTWNALRRSLETNGEIKLPKDYCSSDLDLDTDFEVILPRRRDLGLCSTALVSYLINLHNEIIHTVEKFSKEDSSYSVDASEVTDLHVVSYEVERDLIPLILSNCQYQVEQGGETSQEFDLEKIQRQISSRFLQGKPRLTLKGIPTLVFRHDWNFEHLFVDIKNKMAQSPLPNSATGSMSGELQSYSDACEALSVVEVTLGFLGTAGGDPNMHLDVYVRDTLRMGDQTTPVLKALSRCQLKHAIALWQFLSAHKSEQLLRLKKDPFREIDSRYKADLSPGNTKLLSTFLNHTDLDAFLLELHEMMVLKLRNTQTQDSFNPEWSLRDTLVSYMETKENAVLPEVESQFPEEILLSSCVSVWKAAAARKQDQQAR